MRQQRAPPPRLSTDRQTVVTVLKGKPKGRGGVTNNAQLRVNDSHRILCFAHLACAGWVVSYKATSGDVLAPVAVSVLSEVFSQGLGIEKCR